MSAELGETAAKALAMVGPDVLTRLAASLDAGDLSLAATAGQLQSRLGLPSGRLGPIRQLLKVADTSEALATNIRVAIAVANEVRAAAPSVEVAATKLQAGGRIRTTGGVARDVINGAAGRLLVVGYSVTTDAALAGLAAKTLSAMGDAAKRGVQVTAILHRDEANRGAVLRAWPRAAPAPAFYTWPEQPHDAMAKMHAKVLVADAHDALITSANLTYHGFVGNVEMGVRIIGQPAKTVADVFDRLLRKGQFVEWWP